MKNTARIPEEVKCISLSGNADEKSVIDTKGLECIIKPVGGELYIKAKGGESDADAFVVSDGESFEFCGRITVFAKEALKINCLFCRTL